MADEQITPEEFKALRADLEKAGVKAETLNELEQMLGSEGGLTWGALVSRLTEDMVAVFGGNSQMLNSALTKLGFSQKESTQLMQDMKDGKGKDVFKAITDKIAAKGGVKLSDEELQALNKALGLSEDFKEKLDQVLQGKGTAKDTATLLKQIEVTAQKQTQVVHTVADHMAAQNTKSTQDQKHIQQDASDKNTRPLHNAKVEDPSRQFDQSPQEQNAGADQNESRQDTWGSFFSRLSSDKTTPLTSTLKTDAAGFAIHQQSQLTQTAASKAEHSSMANKAAPKNVLNQVQDGILKNVSPGEKAITLQLKPEALGSLTLMLSVKNKEVSATIKADSPEAARMISDQMESLKKSLEDQGLKISKMEVQTGTDSTKQDGAFSGNQQHNLMHERREMVRMRTHMRMMREEGDTLAQDMQNVRGQAKVSGNGIHLVA